METKIKQKIAIIGAGNQALAWADNLKKSKVDFQIGLRENSSSASIAEYFRVFTLGKELEKFDVLIMLIPDDQHFSFFEKYQQFIKKNSLILYAHSFSLVYTPLMEKFSNFKHALLAPKAIANEIRKNYLKNILTPAVFQCDKSDHDFIKSLASKLKFNLIKKVTLKTEVDADLFSEQNLLCGLYPFFIHECFEVLIENGIEPELAFLELFYESKLIMDTIYEKGPQEFFNLISPNALLGATLGSKNILNDDVKKKIRKSFKEIKSGHFSNLIKQTDFKELKSTTQNFWKNTQIQSQYNKMKSQGAI